MPLTWLLATALVVPAAVPADITPIDCGSCPGWNQPQAPFRLHGDSWYVGTKGLSAVLLVDEAGLVLIDAGLPQSAPLIAANIQALGHELKDIRWILNSHAHYDHAGGIAAMQRMSGARVLATQRGAEALRLGNAAHDDPQAGYGEKANAFPPVADVGELADGDVVVLGKLRLTLHATPGHTPGGSTWQWRSCDGDDCRDLVYADSLTAVAAPGFRYSDDPARVAQFRATLARVEALSCDLVVSAHPGAVGLFEKRAADASVDTGIAERDPEACRRYAAGGRKWLDTRLSEEAAGSP